MLRVEGVFKAGDHIDEWCMIMQAYQKEARVAPRKHIKTSVGVAFLAWKMLRMERNYNEWDFMSYTTDMSEYHLKRGKRLIKAIPEVFGSHKALTDAESIWRYEKDGKEFLCEPSGILTFKRGKHPHGMIIDDPLKDPEKKLDTSQLEKIKTSFLEEIHEMPLYEMHLTGTQQDESEADLFVYIEKHMTDFFFRRYDAIVNEADKRVLWQEMYPWERLMQIKTNIGEKAFNKELRCRPVRGEDGFFKSQEVDRMIKRHLKNYQFNRAPKLHNSTIAGFDIGKKAHPSHFAIFGKDRCDRAVQVHSKFMDGWDYMDQLAYIQEAIKVFSIERLYYDNTRAEFESFSERGELPAECEPITFGSKNKFTMATRFDSLRSRGKVWLLPDERQRRQLLSVDNDLKAVSTVDGHGDAFFSIAMALDAMFAGDEIRIS